jgi:plasmid replication initiation protein
MDINNSKNKLIVKANDLVEAFFEMTQNEYKFILFLISKIRKDDTEFRRQEITVSEFNNLIGIKGTKTYSYMRSFEDSLLTKKIVINSKNGEILKIAWFSYLRYIPRTATLQVAFNADLSPFLLQINVPYTKYFLENIRRLSSYPSMRLYEILKQYLKIGSRTISFDDLRLMLGFTTQYRRFNDFKRRILEPSRKDINACTDLSFEYKEIRIGKRLKEIDFYVKENKNVVEQGKLVVEQGKLDSSDEKIKVLMDRFISLYNGNLDYVLTKALVDKKGIDCVEECIEKFGDYVKNANEVEKVFFDFTMRYGTDREYSKNNSYHNNKPIQATNYEQREYDDDFFNSLYDNVTFVKD